MIPLPLTGKLEHPFHQQSRLDSDISQQLLQEEKLLLPQAERLEILLQAAADHVALLIPVRIIVCIHAGLGLQPFLAESRH